MGKSKPKNMTKNVGKKQQKKKSNHMKILTAGITMIVIAVAIYFTFGFGRNTKGDPSIAQAAVKINKEEVSSTAKFYPYDSDGIKMEVLAVKASDGTIRTALNTCQVCYPTGRGYYIQEDDELVCQNCGNRFQLDMIEVVRDGCNPVPILDENKTDDGTNIVINNNFLDENREMFKNWKN